MRVPEHKRSLHTGWWAAVTVIAGLTILALVVATWFVVPALRVQAAATVTTLASATMSADTAGTAPGSGQYTLLTGPVLQEGADL